MPELPEIEVLVRHLAPLLQGQTVRHIEVRRLKVIRPTPLAEFSRVLDGASFQELVRRGKYLVFTLRPAGRPQPFILLGHLGMTGRIYLQQAATELPRHTAVMLGLGAKNLVYEDTRYFGRFTLDARAVARLGPEPLGPAFSVDYLGQALRRSAQAIKVKLLDQSLLAGVGNIYASEALFAARIPPRIPSRRLTAVQVQRLQQSLRAVLTEAIAWGSTVPLDWAGTGPRDGLFYYGLADGAADYYTERLRVYDREGRPCVNCGTLIRRMVQGGRSTFYCPRCQRG
ncbi:MAG: bifunctional DNA-formamidopyrimidine glycosylase/DNA-(apurinic or apyrimidinic site) lyase [Verrucomicrobia bacterium]|nr:bifunctional DNA-formamidopyrimidine glycosylase/DNA-(apurinic or apyrimidinic site) lyase [Verrucomicrobiota bacterium]